MTLFQNNLGKRWPLRGLGNFLATVKNHVQVATWPGHGFFMSLVALARAAQLYHHELQADLYLVQDTIALNAALQLQTNYPGRIALDVTEYPDWRKRTGAIDFAWTESQFQLTHLLLLGALPQIDFAITLNQELANMMQSQYGLKTWAIENFQQDIIEQRHLAIRQQLGVDDTAILVIYPNNVYTASCFHDVLATFALLPKNFHLITMGNYMPESKRQVYLRMARQLGLHHQFHPLPAISYPQFIQHISGCNFGLVHLDSSIQHCRESFHNRFADLIAAGQPFVFSTNHAASSLCLAHGFAIEYDDRSRKAMLQSILTMADQEQQARAALWRAKKKFVWSKHQPLFDQWLHDIHTVTFISHKNMATNQRTLSLIREMTARNIAVQLLSPFPAPLHPLPGTRWFNAVL